MGCVPLHMPRGVEFIGKELDADTYMFTDAYGDSFKFHVYGDIILMEAITPVFVPPDVFMYMADLIYRRDEF
jgi:hypothetical protein